MGRRAREFGKTGIYHILFRGVNHCHLFEEDADFEKFLSAVKAVKAAMLFDLYAYALMSNHVHLLIREKSTGDIAVVMRKVLTQYAGWFNRKYGRSGALIANRYKSECVEDESYLLTLARYIHQNPVKAGAAGSPEAYRWSSYAGYLGGGDNLTDTDFVLSGISKDRESAIADFAVFHGKLDELEYAPAEGKKKSEAMLHREALGILGFEPNKAAGVQKAERTAAIALLRANGFSIRQVERLTGVPRSIVGRC
ncbi:MAG: transposase [Gracilibacteraceae bacterium]|jgi:REP element-mobilizing transposase RayT|nr:transposase [Gracilibacteraceae bacterium]